MFFQLFSRCFTTKTGVVAMYVEAMHSEGVEKKTSEILYDLQPILKGSRAYDPNEGNLAWNFSTHFSPRSCFSVYRMSALFRRRISTRILHQRPWWVFTISGSEGCGGGQRFKDSVSINVQFHSLRGDNWKTNGLLLHNAAVENNCKLLQTLHELEGSEHQIVYHINWT